MTTFSEVSSSFITLRSSLADHRFSSPSFKLTSRRYAIKNFKLQLMIFLLLFFPSFLYLFQYANKALDSFEFKEFFLKYFTSLSAFDQSVLSQIDWDAWFF